MALICATHRDLKRLVAEQHFREDLYYRVNGVSLRPPLRERDDLASIIEGLLDKFGAKGVTLDPPLAELLEGFDWPGNIRQLEMVLRTALAMREDDEQVLSLEHLTDCLLDELASGAAPSGSLRENELELIRGALTRHQGNVSAAAEALASAAPRCTASSSSCAADMGGLFARLVETSDPQLMRQALAWLYSFVRPHRRAIAMLLGLSLCASLLALAQPWLVKTLIDEGLLARDYTTLWHMAAVMILAGVFGTLLAGINRYLHTRLSGRILFALRDDLYRHLQQLSPMFYGRRRTGDILSRLDGDVAEIQRFAVDSLFSAVSSVIGLLGALALMLMLSWQLSLLLALLIPIEVLWLRWMRRKVEREVRSLRERSTDVSSFLVETLPAMKFIQAAGQQAREARRLEQLGQGYMGQLLKVRVTEFFTQAVPGR